MELTVHYFWLVQLVLLIIGLFTAYKAIVVYKIKSKFWNILAIIAALIYSTVPVKMGYKVDAVQQQRHIEAAKTLPPKVEDNSFKQKTESLQGISKEELWDSTY